MSAEGGIRFDLEATAITRLEDGSIRILAPATVRLTTTREFRMTFSGSPSFVLELHPTKEGAKAVRITGATIRFEGDGSGASISSASSITVLN